MLRQKIVAVPITIGLVMSWSAVLAERPVLSTYGTPGLVELPTAESLPDGNLAFASSIAGTSLRNSVTFQVLPRVYGTFRYAIIDEFFEDGDTRYDRSFDVHWQILDEESSGFDLAVGVRDLIGTGVYSAEYLVATKQVSKTVEVTAGLGWGRLAGRNAFANPLGLVSSSFDDRDERASGFGGNNTGIGGSIDGNLWFRGDVSAFAGVNWNVTDNTSIQLEYSPELYDVESRFSDFSVTNGFNAAVQYRFDNDVSLRAYTLGGENFGAQFNFFLNPKTRAVPAGAESGPRPIVPRDHLAAASWTQAGAGQTTAVLADRLNEEGLQFDDLELAGPTAILYIENLRWDVEAQAAGRATRVMANTLPPEIENFTVVFQRNGLPLSSIATRRADLEDLQYDYDGSWRTLSRATIDGAGQAGEAPTRLTYSLSPYAAFSFFDPQAPVRVDVGPQLDLAYLAAPGLTFAGRFRYPFAGNLDESVRASDSQIQRVRSEAYLYARESEFEINRLSAEYLWRPGDEVFARVSAGYLENMYGGISSELLWRPIESRVALGAEINYVQQRDFDMLFGFRDYDVVTGHASAYYDVGNGFNARIDAGRYLAGDWGATFAVDREFNNGVRVGGYFTLTDVPFDEFGEGSFDKGLEIEFPLSWFTGNPTRLTASQTIQPLLRDGGARLQVDNRLYPLTREYGGAELSDGWGRYLR